MDNSLKPIEAFVQQGLAQRFQQIFNAPLIYTNAPDKRAAAAKLVQRGLKYPFAFASVQRDGITEGTYKPHTLMRRGITGYPNADTMTAQRLNLIPVTTEYEITFMAQSFADVRNFSRTWLLAVVQTAFKFSVKYAVVDLDINVVPDKEVNIPQRETGLSEAKEYVATVNVVVSGYMSNSKLKLAQTVESVEASFLFEHSIETVNQSNVEPITFGVSSSTYIIEEVPDNPTKILIDLSVLAEQKNTFNLVLYGNRTVGFINGSAAFDGMRFALRVTQGQPGGFTILWDPATVKFGSDIPSIDLTPQVGYFDYIGFSYDNADSACDVIAFSRGYSTTTV